MPLTVYIPTPGCDLQDRIDPASGIVGTPEADSQIRIDFEGNRHDSEELRRFADRVHLAAVRHTWNDGEGYPTSARAVVASEELVRVGTYDPPSGTVEVEDEEALMDWLDRDDLPREELVTSHGTEID